VEMPAFQKDWIECLVTEDLLVGTCSYKSWVDYPYFSDHAPVLLRLEQGISSEGISF
jgi:hypothetical protein